MSLAWLALVGVIAGGYGLAIAYSCATHQPRCDAGIPQGLVSLAILLISFGIALGAYFR